MMFKKKLRKNWEGPSRTEEALPEYWKDWKMVVQKFPSGKAFSYMGVTMMVANRTPPIRALYSEWFGWVREHKDPTLVCEYLDTAGVIREHVFGPSMFPVLLKGDPL